MEAPRRALPTNKKPDPANRIYPDENYAREGMQLFSIGLWELNPDGTRTPTYIYGQFPSLAVNPDAGAEINPLDTGRGRLIPTTSVDQFFAEMALWLGVPKSDLPLVLPNIRNFYSPGSLSAPLGYLL